MERWPFASIADGARAASNNTLSNSNDDAYFSRDFASFAIRVAAAPGIASTARKQAQLKALQQTNLRLA